MLMNPIEKHNLIQFEIANFIESHTGTTASLIDILNKASQSYYNTLLNKADTTQQRPVKRTIVTVSIGRTANHRRYGNIFYSYLSSVLVNQPIVFRNLNTTDEPSIDIFDKQYHSEFVTSIYLDSVSNVSVESMTATDADFEKYTITYHNSINNLDYKISIVINK